MPSEDNDQDNNTSIPSSPSTSNDMDFNSFSNNISPQAKKSHANSVLNLNNEESMTKLQNDKRFHFMFQKHSSTSQNEVQKLLETPVEQLNSNYNMERANATVEEEFVQEQVLPNGMAMLLPQNEHTSNQTTSGWNTKHWVSRTESTIERIKSSLSKKDQTVTEVLKNDKKTMGLKKIARRGKSPSNFENNEENYNDVSIEEASYKSKFKYGGEMNLSRRDNEGINERSVYGQNINHELMGNNFYCADYYPTLYDNSAAGAEPTTDLFSINVNQLARVDPFYDISEPGFSNDLHGEDYSAMMDEETHHGPIQRSNTVKQVEAAEFSEMNVNPSTWTNLTPNYRYALNPLLMKPLVPEEPSVVLSRQTSIMTLPEQAGAMAHPITEQARSFTVSISEQVGAISLPMSEPAGAFSLPNISANSYYLNNANDTLPRFQTLMARPVDSTSILRSIIGIPTTNERQNLFSSGAEHFGQNYSTTFNPNRNGFNHNGNIHHDHMTGNPDLLTSANSNGHYRKAPQKKERFSEWKNMFDLINKEKNASKTEPTQKIYRHTYKVESFVDFLVKISGDSSDSSASDQHNQNFSKNKKKKDLRGQPYPYTPKNAQSSHIDNKGTVPKFKNKLWKALPIHGSQYENNSKKVLQQEDRGFGLNYNSYEMLPSDMSQKKGEKDVTMNTDSGNSQEPEKKLEKKETGNSQEPEKKLEEKETGKSQEPEKKLEKKETENSQEPEKKLEKKETKNGQNSQDAPTHICGRYFSLFSDDEEDQEKCSTCNEKLGKEKVTIVADWQKFSVWGGYANEEVEEQGVDGVIKAESKEEEKGTTMDHDEQEILYEGRNILDLMFNITNPSWNITTTSLPEFNLKMFIDNRSQYYRLSDYNDDAPEYWSCCPGCSFNTPMYE